MDAKATLKKISEHLNLSISTVSRALKDHPDIAETTKQKVRELAALLDYEPNAMAVNLRTNSSKLFGLIVPSLSNHFYESVAAAAENKARERGYTLMIFQSGNDAQQEAEGLRLCRLNRVAGILMAMVPGSDAAAFRKLKESKIPVVFLDIVPAEDQYDKVCVADEQAAEMAAELLISRQKKKVLALFGNPDMSITRKREDVMCRLLKDAGIEFRAVHAHSSDECTKSTAEALDNWQPDAIFAMSDELLIGVMRTVYARQIAVPAEIGLLAISNGYLPHLFHPAITYIETSGSRLGEMAAQRLLDLIAGQTFTRTLLVPARLVEGKSI